MKVPSLFFRLFRSSEAVLVCEDFDARSNSYLGTFHIDGAAEPSGDTDDRDLSALIEWARTQSREVVVQIGDDRYSAGAARIKDLPAWQGQGLEARRRFSYEAENGEPSDYWVRFDFGYDESRAADISTGLLNDRRVLDIRNVDPSAASFECRLKKPVEGAIEALAFRIVTDLALGQRGALTAHDDLAAPGPTGLILAGGASVTVVSPA